MMCTELLGSGATKCAKDLFSAEWQALELLLQPMFQRFSDFYVTLLL